jgi:hypothetical protein
VRAHHVRDAVERLTPSPLTRCFAATTPPTCRLDCFRRCCMFLLQLFCDISSPPAPSSTQSTPSSPISSKLPMYHHPFVSPFPPKWRCLMPVAGTRRHSRSQRACQTTRVHRERVQGVRGTGSGELYGPRAQVLQVRRRWLQNLRCSSQMLKRCNFASRVQINDKDVRNATVAAPLPWRCGSGSSRVLQAHAAAAVQVGFLFC